MIEGTITSFTPAINRTPDLYTVQYDGGFTERLTVGEVEIGLALMEKRLTSCLSASTIDHERNRVTNYEAVMKERGDIGMEVKVTHEIIWKLVLVAAMEIEYEQRVTNRLEKLQAANGGKANQRCRYYKEHPTTYLGGQYVPPVEETQDNEGKATLVPNVIAQRLRSGIARACDVYQSTTMEGFETSRRSNRIASNASPTAKPNALEVGGAVALTLLKIFDETESPAIGQAGEILRSNEVDDDKATVANKDDNEDEEINEFYIPSAHAIFTHLRSNRSTSASDIQQAIFYAMEDSVPMTLPLVGNLTKINDDLIPDPLGKVSLVCISGETLKTLNSYDASSFSRCRFKISFEATGESESPMEVQTDPIQAKEMFRKEEKAWRARKHFETWRHLSVNSGNTTWPSWSDHVSNILKEKRINNIDDNESSIAIVDEETAVNQKNEEDPDFKLAQAIAEPATSRRSRRATRGDNADGPIFYGANQSMTAQQILETIERLVIQAKQKGMVLLDLKKLIMGDGENSNFNATTDLKRVRVALGKLVFRLGKIERMLVSEKSDKICWERLYTGKDSSLVKLRMLPSIIRKVTDKNKPALIENGVNGAEESNDLPPTVGKTGDSKSDNVSANESFQKTEIISLQSYIYDLHQTELSLRQLFLKQNKSTKGANAFQQITPILLSMSADERVSASENIDKSFFFNDPGENGEGGGLKSDINWVTEPIHPLVGQIIYRPSFVNMDKMLYTDVSNLTCDWYKVVSYCPSKPLEESVIVDEATKDGLVTKESDIVGRRIHFLVELSSKSNDIVNDALVNGEQLVLTEAQVYAGKNAAEHHLKIQSNTVKKMTHPFRGLVGTRILLHPIDGVVNLSPLNAIIAGHDTSILVDQNKIEWRLLVIVDQGEQSAECFWGVLSSDSGTLSRVEVGTSYRVENQEYHPASKAHETCKVVLAFLKANVKIVPFLEPVDPIALNIPEYTEIVKQPMDLSTVTKKLERGEYGRIPSGTEYSSPVSKMLHGPFYEDIMRVFENAILFNPKGDWIHDDALTLKGLVSRKIETLTTKAESQAGANALALSGRKRVKASSSIYVAEDSDVDIYEYESDNDDEYDADASMGRRSAKRNRSKSGTPRVEDYATRAIETPIIIPNQFDSPLFGILPVSTDARSFGLPEEWACRKRKEIKTDKEPTNNTNRDIEIELEELAMIQKQISVRQDTSIRRSSRARGSGSAQANSSVGASCALHGVEFILKNDGPLKEATASMESATDRLGVEKLRETLHEEYYANLYYKYCSSGANIQSQVDIESDDGIGVYTDGSFPPYLGRVVPTGKSSSQGQDVTWEIRAEFVVPAIRWILRGLVQSEHFSEWEPFSLQSYETESILLANHSYYQDQEKTPYEILDVRKKKGNTAEEEEEEEEVELSAYEKMRAERVARNKEKLKALGLA